MLLLTSDTFFLLPQTLRDEDLRILGRDHSSLQALRTVEEARRLCPGRVSVDVMFGRPGQSVEAWGAELSEVLGVCDDHVSLYQLTLERGTELFGLVERGEASVPGEDATSEMYRRARTTLHRHGFVQYEVSNFARNVSLSELLRVRYSRTITSEKWEMTTNLSC